MVQYSVICASFEGKMRILWLQIGRRQSYPFVMGMENHKTNNGLRKHVDRTENCRGTNSIPLLRDFSLKTLWFNRKMPVHRVLN